MSLNIILFLQILVLLISCNPKDKWNDRVALYGENKNAEPESKAKFAEQDFI